MDAYLPTNDLLFKKTFTSKGHEHILLGFIEDVLGESFERVYTSEPYNIKAYDFKKLSKTEVDILAETNTGDYVTIEMQVQPHSYFIERTLFYLFSAYTKRYNVKHTEKGQQRPYHSLRKTYGINITHFNLFEAESSAIRHFTLQDQQNGIPLAQYDVRDIQASYFSLTNPHVQSPHIKDWQDFFLGRPLRDEAPDYIHEAKTIAQNENLSKEERIMVDAIAKYEAIQMERDADNIEKGREEGRVEGRAEGREEERKKAEENMRQTILRLAKMELTPAQIAQAVDWSEEKIKQVLASH